MWCTLDQVKVLEWKAGKDLHLPKEHRPAGPYRLTMVYEDGAFLPLQQCVNVSKEVEHTVESDAWFREPGHLREWELEPVRSQLFVMVRTHGNANYKIDDKLPTFDEKRGGCGRFTRAKLEGPLRKKINLAFKPQDETVLVDVIKVGKKFREVFDSELKNFSGASGTYAIGLVENRGWQKMA